MKVLAGGEAIWLIFKSPPCFKFHMAKLAARALDVLAGVA